MVSLSQVESDLVTAMKAKDQLSVETLRGLKTRIQNEKVAKMGDLLESDIVALVKNEIKRRKDSAEVYTQAARQELADKELKEAAILEKYLPPQMSETELSALIEKTITENSFTAADFGKAMGKLKAQVGNSADGAALAKILKEKLK